MSTSGAFGAAPDEIISAGGNIETLTGEVERTISSMMKIATGLSATWTGAAHGAFEGAMRDWQAASAKITEASHEMARATKMAGSNYGDAETTNLSMFPH